jgi:hypothetical protein
MTVAAIKSELDDAIEALEVLRKRMRNYPWDRNLARVTAMKAAEVRKLRQEIATKEE